MSNKQAPTQRQRAERARREAMGIAVIQRPLKYIKGLTDQVEKDDVTGQTRVLESRQSRLATLAARYGAGEAVKQIARRLR